MRKLVNSLLIISLIFLFTNLTFGAHSTFTASLTGLQEVPPVNTPAMGTAAITFTPSGGLIFVVSVNGLSGPITGAHFHYGSMRQSGPVVFDITPSFAGGSNAAGFWPAASMPDSILAGLFTGKIYMNVHTAANPSGEIRGQVNLTSGTYLIARMDGQQEVPSLPNSAKGTASLTLTGFNGVGLAFSISVNGLSRPITGAHFHYANIGVSGPVVKDLTPLFAGGNNALGLWKTTDAQPLNDSLILALLTGRLYVNVHTAANPSGEIRGQVLLASGFGFNANLDGASEFPPVTTNAKATASFTLTDYGLVYKVTVQGLSSGMTGSHFHNADSGTNGSVVHDITNSYVNNTAYGVWRSSPAAGDLTPALMKELFNRRLYLNIHTSNNTAGEVRGQLNPHTAMGFTANLEGNQEAPIPVITNAKGTASFYTVPNGLAYFITVTGLSGPITGSHFHYGGLRTAGPVVKDLTSSFSGTFTAFGVWGTGDPQPLNDSLRQALVNGKLYVNVHTASNPAGEIRGQVLLNAGSGLGSMLDGLQEVPSVTTTARGTASYTLTRDGLQFNVSFSGLSGPVTGTHFHYGYVGQSGPVIKDLGPYLSGNNITGFWPEVVTVDSLYNALLSGRIYVNLHTAANPAGEIRGQVLLREGIGLTIQLDGLQEVPPVTTNAKGTGSATITDAGIFFASSVNGLSGAVSGTHFHNAPQGVPGPVVKDLVFFLNGNNLLGAWKRTDIAQPLSNLMLAKAVMNNLYLNFHTVLHPAGEIRGQLKSGEIIPIGVEPVSGKVPEVYSLSQNYPNPFNPATVIEFSIPVSSNVKLEIFDVLGRSVSTIIDRNMKAGAYEVTFDASGLSSGIYFYRLEASGFTGTKKMLIVK